MGRYSKIHLGPARKNDPQVREALTSVAIKPGSFAVLTSGKWALASAATVGKVWLMQENYLALKGVDANIPNDSVGLGLELQDDTHYAALLAASQNVQNVGTPLKLAANGELAIASAGTDLVVAYADEVYNNNTGAAQLIRIRVPGGTPGPKGEDAS